MMLLKIGRNKSIKINQDLRDKIHASDDDLVAVIRKISKVKDALSLIEEDGKLILCTMQCNHILGWDLKQQGISNETIPYSTGRLPALSGGSPSDFYEN